MTLKTQLRLILSDRGMTAAELSRKAGVSKQVISLWLNGAKPKNIDQVKNVADALGLTLDHLLFGTGLPEPVENLSGLDALIGDDWVSGQFEIKIRKIRKGQR